MLVRLAELVWVLVYPTMFYVSMSHDKPIIGIASRYGDPGDVLGSGAMSCTKKSPDNFVMGCAHRVLPCGTLLLLENPRTRMMTFCRVLDRGPYGALLNGKWVIKIRWSDPGTWRGVLDLTPAVSDALGHNGFEKVRMWVISYPKQRVRTRVSREIASLMFAGTRALLRF